VTNYDLCRNSAKIVRRMRNALTIWEGAELRRSEIFVVLWPVETASPVGAASSGSYLDYAAPERSLDFEGADSIKMSRLTALSSALGLGDSAAKRQSAPILLQPFEAFSNLLKGKNINNFLCVAASFWKPWSTLRSLRLHPPCTLCEPKLYPTPAYANLCQPYQAKNISREKYPHLHHLNYF